MRHSLAIALGSTVLLVSLLGGCKKEETAAETVKDTSAEGTPKPAPTAAPTPSAAATDSAATSPDGGPPPTDVPVATGHVQPKGQGLEACCSALNSEAANAPQAKKARAKQAAALCGSISSLVKQGSTSRGAALTSLRSAAGGSLPGACR
jgi:hypothetical protein